MKSHRLLKEKKRSIEFADNSDEDWLKKSAEFLKH
jgi:hypothetical protein